MAVCPLRPATDLRLGEPLPHQLANQPRAPSSATFAFLLSDLCGISSGFPELFPTKEWIPTCYSPVCHFTHVLLHFLVRLACVKRAANVDSEPGSNSQLNCVSLSIWSGISRSGFPISLNSKFDVIALHPTRLSNICTIHPVSCEPE